MVREVDLELKATYTDGDAGSSLLLSWRMGENPGVALTHNWRREGGELENTLIWNCLRNIHSSVGTNFGCCPQTQSPNGRGNLGAKSLSPHMDIENESSMQEMPFSD